MLPTPIKTSTGESLKNEKGEEVYVTDAMVERLLDDEILKETEKKRKEERAKFTKTNVHQLRIRAKRDLFFLCYAILGNTRLSPNLHGNLCTQVRRTENDRFHEYLLARGNFKSTILTIGKTIQTVLPIDAEDLKYDGWWIEKPTEIDLSPLPWPASLGTDCRCLIGHETHEGSARFLYAITNHFIANPLLQALFPEAIPSPRKQRINKWELELPRNITGNPEPTIDTLGVGGKSQGRHYNRIALDDIFGDKARDSLAEAETVKDWFDNIQSFFSTFKKDTLDLVGTRYSHDDIYAHAEERYGKQLIVYRRKIEEVNPTTGEKEITFPEEFTPESLEILKKNKRIYNAQYLNDPDEGEAGFKKEYKRYFYWRGLNDFVVFDGGKQSAISVRDLDICILIDPGLGRSGGLVVTGEDHLERVFALVALRLEMKAPELTELVFKQVVRWQPRLVAVESDLFASTFEYWWGTEMKRRQIRFKVYPVYTKKKSKDDRIAGLEQYFAGNQFFFNDNQIDLEKEIDTWGKSKDIHILDALAYGPEVWQKGFPPGSGGRIGHDSSSSDEGLEDRDVETGYSAID